MSRDVLSAVKRAQIIAGAEAVFSVDGYERASMTRIAAVAGVSKGTLYNHFTSKSDLLAAFMEEKIARTLTSVFDVPSVDKGTEDTLYEIGMQMIELMLAPGSRVLYRIAISETGKFPHLAKLLWDGGPQKAVGYMARWLEAQVSAGRLRPMDADFAAEPFFALCQTRIVARCRFELPTDTSLLAIERVIRAATRLFLAEYGSNPL